MDGLHSMLLCRKENKLCVGLCGGLGGRVGGFAYEEVTQSPACFCCACTITMSETGLRHGRKDVLWSE